MKRIHKITLLFLTTLLFVACSRKKNTYMSRNYHSVTAEYNSMYNGSVALDKGKSEVALTYKDDFWKILPVERIEIKKEKVKPGEKTSSNFSRAEEKAAKAIQKHSIYVGGKEYNPQIDEAYMMLGKARYYDERFIASQDAFNFILNRYATSNSVNQARMWKAKTNIRLSNEEGALEELGDLIKKGGLSKEDLADASAIIAQAYINLDSIKEALPYIKNASAYVNDTELKGRYSYIKGQIFNRLGQKDSANAAFQEVIDLNRKSPRIYMINAYIAQSKNFDYDKGDKIVELELLDKLAKNRENRPFLDIIFNQKGEYYLKTQNIDSSVSNYNKSIKKYKENRTLQSVNYSTLAEINFDRAKYRTAGAYYDSTLTFLEEKSRSWRRIKKKRENLDDVIKYEDIAFKNDSILKIVSLGEAERLAYFTEYTQKLKKQSEEDSLADLVAQESIANKEFYKKAQVDRGGDVNGGAFYFYNSTTVSFGKQEFNKIWGKRELGDYWRLSSKKRAFNEQETAENPIEQISNSEKFNPETYIAQIPTDPVVIDSIAKERNFAYYQLGIIYKEKFREYSLATDKLEQLLSFAPQERLVLPSKYNLYKIYQFLGDEANTSKWKNDILNNHSSSRYAEILKNPDTQLETDESSPEFRYKQLYKEFEAQRYQYVVATADEYITIYTGNGIVPKLEMLKATALARQEGYEAYKKQLNFVALNYPQSSEGKEAQDIYSNVLPKISKKEFDEAASEDTWKVIYKFNAQEKETAETLKTQLEEAITSLNETKMSISLDYFNPTTLFVIIHGLDSKLGSKGFAEVLRENKEYKVQYPYFEISSPNYKVIQLHKNLDDYLTTNTEKEEKESPQK